MNRSYRGRFCSESRFLGVRCQFTSNEQASALMCVAPHQIVASNVHRQAASLQLRLDLYRRTRGIFSHPLFQCSFIVWPRGPRESSSIPSQRLPGLHGSQRVRCGCRRVGQAVRRARAGNGTLRKTPGLSRRESGRGAHNAERNSGRTLDIKRRGLRRDTPQHGRLQSTEA